MRKYFIYFNVILNYHIYIICSITYFLSASNYTFFVSNDSSLNYLQLLPNNHKSILTDISSLLVDAGTKLELEIDFGMYLEL